MSERRPQSESPSFSVSDAEALAHPDLRSKYTWERVSAVKAGYPVWKIRGFAEIDDRHADPIFDFYHKNIRRGYIEGNDDDGYFAWGIYLDMDLDEERAIPLASSFDSLSEAQRVLSETIAETRYRITSG